MSVGGVMHVAVAVLLDVLLGVGVDVRVAVRELVAVAVAVRVAVGVRVDVAVAVAVRVRVGVALGVAVGVGLHLPPEAAAIAWMSACATTALKTSISLSVNSTKLGACTVPYRRVPPIHSGVVLLRPATGVKSLPTR